MWRFEVRAPDGRVWQFTTESGAKAKAAAFNQHVTRGGKLAQVVTLPTYR